MNELINNIDKIHTTKLGIMRIKKNINNYDVDVVEWCKNAVINNDTVIKTGKNYYVTYQDYIITINSYSYTIITVHKRK